MPAKPGLTQPEKDKLTIDPNIDFRQVAQRTYADITKNELGMFKWCGVYAQLQPGYFMIRLRLPGGTMKDYQLHRAADLAKKYAQDQLCITTRQTLQFHWVRQKDIYKVIEQMEQVGISAKNACGDVTRNVITCEMQGVCEHELGDTRKILDRIADDYVLLNEQRNFPRKHKISVAGCGRACGQTLMNCQGWYPVVDRQNGSSEIGWKFHAGGGLGALPHMAKVIFDWVPEDMVLDVARAAAEAFRRYGNRRKRRFARVKILVDRLGQKGYQDILFDIMREAGVTGLDRIKRSASVPDVGESYLMGQSFIAQRQDGYYTVRCIIERSELSTERAHMFADWSTKYGNAEVMFTARQNVQLRFVQEDKLQALIGELEREQIQLNGHESLPDAVACVGTTMCNLAVSDTPNTYRKIINALSKDKKYWQSIGPLTINMNGCPNSCAQHWVSDIGLRGMRKREEFGSDEGFTVYVGGYLSAEGHIAEYVTDVRATDVVLTIKHMIDVYLNNRHDEKEIFRHYIKRVGVARFRKLLNLDNPIPRKAENIRNVEMKELFSQVIKEAGNIENVNKL